MAMFATIFFLILAVVSFLWQELYSKEARFLKYLSQYYPATASELRSKKILGMTQPAVKSYIEAETYKKLGSLPSELQTLAEELSNRYLRRAYLSVIGPYIMVLVLVLSFILRHVLK